MKKTNFYLGLTAIVFALSVFTSCKKDDEETNNDYYGKWESREYPSLSMTGTPILEQMKFDFTNTGVEGKIYQGVTSGQLVLALGMIGSIAYTAPSTLDLEINQISIQGAPYVDKTIDETSFYTQFDATLGNKLHEEFTATYTFISDTMVLTLPIINPGGGDDLIVSLKLLKIAE